MVRNFVARAFRDALRAMSEMGLVVWKRRPTGILGVRLVSCRLCPDRGHKRSDAHYVHDGRTAYLDFRLASFATSLKSASSL